MIISEVKVEKSDSLFQTGSLKRLKRPIALKAAYGTIQTLNFKGDKAEEAKDVLEQTNTIIDKICSTNFFNGGKSRLDKLGCELEKVCKEADESQIPELEELLISKICKLEKDDPLRRKWVGKMLTLLCVDSLFLLKPVLDKGLSGIREAKKDTIHKGLYIKRENKAEKIQPDDVISQVKDTVRELFSDENYNYHRKTSGNHKLYVLEDKLDILCKRKVHMEQLFRVREILLTSQSRAEQKISSFDIFDRINEAIDFCLSHVNDRLRVIKTYWPKLYEDLEKKFQEKSKK